MRILILVLDVFALYVAVCSKRSGKGLYAYFMYCFRYGLALVTWIFLLFTLPAFLSNIIFGLGVFLVLLSNLAMPLFLVVVTLISGRLP